MKNGGPTVVAEVGDGGGINGWTLGELGLPCWAEVDPVSAACVDSTTGREDGLVERREEIKLELGGRVGAGG